jgi:hypothetical protein
MRFDSFRGYAESRRAAGDIGTDLDQPSRSVSEFAVL